MSDAIKLSELDKIIDRLTDEALEVEACVGEMPTAVEALTAVRDAVNQTSSHPGAPFVH